MVRLPRSRNRSNDIVMEKGAGMVLSLFCYPFVEDEHMNRRQKHRSVTQNYIDLTDFLAALRSVKELVYAVIITALIVSCAMYVLYDIVPVKGVFSGDTEEVSVLIQVRGYDLQEDDVVVLKKGRNCATVLSQREKQKLPGQGTAENNDLIAVRVNSAGKSQDIRLVSSSAVEGKIGFVVFPLNRFGEDVRKLL